ncbi:5-formyltetrahydrofolate cyclo-ligase [Paucisalibacillus globulus]|uniref:5-formyltetrahydrofolate cyclo-ligase n=1 Tax=Paucisalibacillus globulus TaxID=351095 RepID=UPI000BB8653A|nr:5-formyltetrahydrofolate cyclo-ligase [Paucisalibacillus globulus]
MKKEELRKQTINVLKNLTPQHKDEVNKILHNQLLQSDLWKQSDIIGITISRGFEWDTSKIIEAGWEQGKTIAVPKCDPKGKRLDFYRLHSFNELETVYYNLLEPKPVEQNQISKQLMDLIIVPGIVFDLNGYRIGFGGGYYDRFLDNYEGTTVSLLSKCQLTDNVPSQSFDIPVKHLLTEDGFVK